ncbi:MAG: type II secretion system minor pseudopilin GspK [Brevundimonas sp.]|uniref:type II secretion system minor pseudopilin GspK n=1 Tax=Brevundimonas sp. TaxID=1871086 RepID=UPI00391C623E
MSKPNRRRGMALLNVLLLVTIISALSIGFVDDIRFGIRRAENTRFASQARWYAHGLEQLAMVRIARLLDADSARTSLAGNWHQQDFSFPTDDDGTLTASLRDAGACFNLNSVVEGAGDLIRSREAGIRQYRVLLGLLGIGEARAAQLADALADFIDTDAFRSPAGAEDEAYASLGYRTAGTLLSEPSELRAIRGYDPQVYALIRPHVCALPQSGPTPVNINTLAPESAVVLAALSEGQIGVGTFEQVLAQRPPGGWRSLDDFLASRAFDGRPPEGALLAQLGLTTRYFALESHVTFQGAQIVSSALIEASGPDAIRLVARRWSLPE